MFNYNTVEGKQARVDKLTELIQKVGTIPGNYLSYTDARAVQEYLLECKRDIQKQLNEHAQQARRQNT